MVVVVADADRSFDRLLSRVDQLTWNSTEFLRHLMILEVTLDS